MATLVGFLRRVQREDEEIVWRGLPRPRVFRDRMNPLDLRTDEELLERYRFRCPTIFFLFKLVENSVRHPTVRSLALSPMVQLLVFQRFTSFHWCFPAASRGCYPYIQVNSWEVHKEAGVGLCRPGWPFHQVSHRSRSRQHKAEISQHRKYTDNYFNIQLYLMNPQYKVIKVLVI